MELNHLTRAEDKLDRWQGHTHGRASVSPQRLDDPGKKEEPWKGFKLRINLSHVLGRSLWPRWAQFGYVVTTRIWTDSLCHALHVGFVANLVPHGSNKHQVAQYLWLWSPSKWGLSLNSSKDMNKAPTCKSNGVVSEPHSSRMHSEPNAETPRFAPETGLVPETAKRGDGRVDLKRASQVRGSQWSWDMGSVESQLERRKACGNYHSAQVQLSCTLLNRGPVLCGWSFWPSETSSIWYCCCCCWCCC